MRALPDLIGTTSQPCLLVAIIVCMHMCVYTSRRVSVRAQVRVCGFRGADGSCLYPTPGMRLKGGGIPPSPFGMIVFSTPNAAIYPKGQQIVL